MKSFEIILPDLGEGIDEVTISDVLISEKDNIKKDDILIMLESEKATMEIPSEVGGTIIEILVSKGDIIKPGEPILTIDLDTALNETPIESKPETTSEDSKNTLKLDNKPSQKSNIKDNNEFLIYASPSVRKLSRKLNIDLGLINGTGLKSRITQEDLYAWIKNKIHSKHTENKIQQEPEIDFSLFGETESKKLNKIKTITSKRLQNAWKTIPHVTQFDKCNISYLEILKDKYKNNFKNNNSKLTFLPLIMKAIMFAINDFPQFNSSLNSQKNILTLKKYFNFGIAMDTDDGLVVPIIKDVDKKNIFTLSNQLIEMNKKAKNKKLTPKDFEAGTFTISSLGSLGGDYFSPIINPPEVAIIGVSKAKIEPEYIDGKFSPCLMLPYSLSYDHRVIDGAEAVRFCKKINAFLENKELLNAEFENIDEFK